MARLTKKAQEAIEDALAASAPIESAGLGIDLVDVDRMRGILQRTPSFPQKVFSHDEREYCDSKANPAMHYAARFAAKEAAVKALGCGFADGVACKDVEVVRSRSGKPELKLRGGAARVAQKLGVIDIPLSMSHTGDYAIACAIAITEGVRAGSKGRGEPEAELAKQFKDVRKMLDEI